MNDLLSRYHKLSGRIISLQDDLENKEDLIKAKGILIDTLNKSRWVITEVQKNTQTKFKEKIDSLVTMAIKSVYDRPFGFELIFERKRDKMECRPLIYEIVDGEKEYYTDAEDELGGGIVDICSFALRVVLWTMERPRSRNVFVLDEPGKNLGQLISLFGKILREISHRLKFQLIIITHDDSLIEIGDKNWEVTHDGRESHIILIKGTAEDIPEVEKKIEAVPSVGTKRKRK